MSPATLCWSVALVLYGIGLLLAALLFRDDPPDTVADLALLLLLAALWPVAAVAFAMIAVGDWAATTRLPGGHKEG